MMPRHFYMLRHGQTQANLSECVAGGGVDTPLTDEGRAQARAARDVIAGLSVPPRTIVHSSLSRARDTARIVNESLGFPIYENSDLCEQSVGEMEGAPFPVFRDWILQEKDPPGGETLDAFRARIRRGIGSTIEAHPAPVLIVSHGGVFRAFGDLYRFAFRGVGNCHLYEFEPCPGDSGVPWRIQKKHGHEQEGTAKGPFRRGQPGICARERDHAGYGLLSCATKA